MTKSASHRFREFVKSFSPAMPLMPAMHSCFGSQFQRIMDSRQIKIGALDPVIGRPAAFCFYGKPSYRPRDDRKFSSEIRSALFCIVIDYAELGTADGMLPFDSGGYQALWSEICSNAPIDEYYLAGELNAPARFVSAFFGDNERYYRMKLRDGVQKEIKTFDFHSGSIVDICTPSGSVNYDQRAASIDAAL